MTNLAFMTADGFPPGRTDACETPLASQANRGQCEQGRECGGDRHGEHAGRRHCTKHVLPALNPTPFDSGAVCALR